MCFLPHLKKRLDGEGFQMSLGNAAMTFQFPTSTVKTYLQKSSMQACQFQRGQNAAHRSIFHSCSVPPAQAEDASVCTGRGSIPWQSPGHSTHCSPSHQDFLWRLGRGRGSCPACNFYTSSQEAVSKWACRQQILGIMQAFFQLKKKPKHYMCCTVVPPA